MQLLSSLEWKGHAQNAGVSAGLHDPAGGFTAIAGHLICSRLAWSGFGEMLSNKNPGIREFATEAPGTSG